MILTVNAYAPLQFLLSDPAIPKVGVDANEDAQHLARWCGIKDRDYIGYFFWGIRDTEEEGDDCVKGKTLLTMCKQVFQHCLPRIKQKMQKIKRKKKRKVGLAMMSELSSTLFSLANNTILLLE
jgi:hypothetical protein